MRGPLVTSPAPGEARLRDDGGRKLRLRNRDSDEIEEPSLRVKISASTAHPWTCIFVIMILISFCSLMLSTAVNRCELSVDFLSRSKFLDRGLIVDWKIADLRYVSKLEVNWETISKVINSSCDLKKNSKVGLLNFNSTEINTWQKLVPKSEIVIVGLDPVNPSLKWEDLFPEWIDEEEEFEVPKCPSLPEPKPLVDARLDLIIGKLPCNRSALWSKDVVRLHLQLSAAKMAVSSTSPLILFITDCFPMPNLFKCKDLVSREGTLWLFRPNVRSLQESIQLPIGSCTLSLPLNAVTGEARPKGVKREAYATILHSSQQYVCGAIVAAQSIRMSGSHRDLVILVDEMISNHQRQGLTAAGWKVRTIQRIRNPKARKDAYNEWNYSKFRLWQLTDYDKVVFIDADLLVLRNIDILFSLPEITAAGNNASLFNSGVMVLEPSNCTFDLLMSHKEEIESYNGGDQGYLNAIFTWWHRIPRRMNFLKYFWAGNKEEKKQAKIRLFGADPPILYVLHYLGLKPWLCFRDYDCNWNVDIFQEFSSDVAHERWWRVHDAMTGELQSFCLLRSKQKAALEWHRRQAEKRKHSDGHWRRKIRDPRLRICDEKFCNWKSMLLHWGKT